jgi:hypothetical protein
MTTSDITIIMPAKLREVWLNALLSGDYQQGHRALRDANGGYCCLGVLQMAVDGEVETELDMTMKSAPKTIPKCYPSRKWLADHNIQFKDNDGSLTSNPYLPSIGALADRANDGRFDTLIGDYVEVVPFSELAAHIAACSIGVDDVTSL